MSPHPVSAVLKFILVFCLAIAGGLLVRNWVLQNITQFRLPERLAMPVTSTPANEVASASTPMPSKPMVPSATDDAVLAATEVPIALPSPVLAAPDLPESETPKPAHLQVTVLVAGVRHASTNGRMALPGGTRFQLEVVSDVAGTLELYEQMPQAGDAPLWREEFNQAGSSVSPVLRLAGKHRLETLHVRLLGQDQRVIGERRVEILHL